MNRRELLRELTRKGCHLERHGGRHDIYVNPVNGRKVPIPRHNEVKNSLCDLIRKQLGIEEP
ncbi:MAG TPA: type II toxin-antitoxin system HicA family toxin [Thermoanaerobaculia bacterium]|nr:type II toxin-antitoxin system HicA family toxin [Thermoanaerobaculia bacterium]